MTAPKRAAVIATGWVGDTIACSAAAASLHEERGFAVDFYIKWPQLASVLRADPRYRTHVYQDTRWGRWQLWQRCRDYHLIVREPAGWTYDEPFTSEIRRQAGCFVRPDYSLPRPPSGLAGSMPAATQRPRLAVARDLYKRAYGRDVDALVSQLNESFELVWVGLPPDKSSKRGRRLDLMPDAVAMCQAAGFVGPEGGLLWLAAGLGVRCAYFTEHIAHVAESTPRGDPWRALGSVNLFPDGPHVALPAQCNNDSALAQIQTLFS